MRNRYMFRNAIFAVLLITIVACNHSADSLKVVVKELGSVLLDYKRHLAITWFGLKSDELPTEHRELIDSELLKRIRFAGYIPPQIPPPPPMPL